MPPAPRLAAGHVQLVLLVSQSPRGSCVYGWERGSQPGRAWELCLGQARLLMETSGDCSSPYVRVTPGFLAHLQELEPRVVRRRLSQARHRATLAGLFNSLRETVYSQSDNLASKCQVLRKAKNYIQELEQTLGTLLKMKESFSLEDGNPSSLEEVKEEYIKMYFNHHSSASPSDTTSESGSTMWYLIQEYEKKDVEGDGRSGLMQSPTTSSPDLMEFERYLYFYKQTVDLLVENGIVCTEEVTLPVVSTAISHLWQELTEERRESVLQYCSQRQNVLPNARAQCSEPVCTEGSVRDSTANSQEASGSSVSTPEEVLFEDAFDVAAGFLDRNEMQTTSNLGSAFSGCTSENPEDIRQLYLQIIGFLKGLFFVNTPFPQGDSVQFDYETVMLRCTETFDDEDL
ncbi:stimulated by retinoic acid gene 8 protein homolog isoform X2 [Alligator mississippiensis]|uniref:stimulated by retinoic acid gene 8 protein homolog isoform X2 n=1 Tax=Alligator mississippiensis TaxID=8496 RepID=UPI00287781CD|nr:stimulated by retinoic acid gene 8 protein homolog isoform X2 [Alligator mississippiensis]